MTLSMPTHALAIPNHRHVATSVSTNSELIDAINNHTLSADIPHVLTAETQTAGRGQHTRSWQSPRGNVYLSYYHPLFIPLTGLLSLIVGTELVKMPIIQSLNERLQAQNLITIGVKWANDLGFYDSEQPASVVDNKLESQIIPFNKLAGILIEPVWLSGKLVGVVIGVGLNVKTTPNLTNQTLEGMSYQAVSLQDIFKTAVQNEKTSKVTELPTLPTIYWQIHQALLSAMRCFAQVNAAQSQTDRSTSGSTQQPIYTTNDFVQQFAVLDVLLGQKLRITQNYNNNERIITGHAHGIDTNGCLQLQQYNGNLSAIFTGRIDVIGGV